MRMGLISDIHGNIQALNHVLSKLDQEGIDMVLCAGDLVCYGADHNQVLQTLHERHIPCVVGNYDYAVAWNQPRASQSLSSPLTEPLKRTALDWAKSHITPASKNFLRSLPSVASFKFGDCSLTMLHATLERLDEELLPDQTARLADLAWRLHSNVIVLGHTHYPFKTIVHNTLFVNPGAVGRSLNRDLRAIYAILDTETFEVEFCKVEYDIDAAVQSIRNSAMPSGVATLVEHGARRLEEVVVQ